MDVNAIGMPTNRPVSVPPNPTVERTETKAVVTADPSTVNSAKSALPEGVGTKVDKTA